MGSGLEQKNMDSQYQIKHAVRIEKIAPLPASEAPAGYYGGKPILPDHIAWPCHEGEPMVFLARLDCSKIPARIWGGDGPRTGWLLFFLPYRFSGAFKDLRCAVLHVDGSCTERSVEVPTSLVGDLAWARYESKNFLPATTTPFPICPVRFLEIEETGKFEGTTTGKNASVAPDQKADLVDRTYPITWDLFEHLLDTLTINLDERCAQYKMQWKRHYKQIRSIHAKPPEDRTYADEQRLAICKDTLAALRLNWPKLRPAKEHLDQFLELYRAQRTSGIVEESIWRGFFHEISKITVPSLYWVTQRRSYERIQKETFKYVRAFEARPGSYLELSKRLTAVIVAASNVLRGSAGKVSVAKGHEQTGKNFERAAEEYSDRDDTDPDVAAYLDVGRKILEENGAEIEAAIAVANDCHKRGMELRNSLEGRDGYPEKIPDDVIEQLEPHLEGLFVIERNSENGVERLGALEKLEFSNSSLIGKEGFHNREWKAKQHFELLRRYSEAPDTLPHATRSYQEGLYLRAANKHHDGLGGLPRWDWSDISWFLSYDSALEEESKPYVTRANPPFDKDNAVLLQLFSSDLPGWMFGDVSHIVFIIPQANLARCDFSAVVPIVGG